MAYMIFCLFLFGVQQQNFTQKKRHNKLPVIIATSKNIETVFSSRIYVGAREMEGEAVGAKDIEGWAVGGCVVGTEDGFPEGAALGWDVGSLLG
jgi:hypothetical protein